ncbi:MAG: hypothetical protein QOJ65_1870 [Fimbriimonadaceae bacterium]|jgi:hypothetical protein|nr:hypothetical protein [Fimbriimonadaceae bacterium]
MSLEGAYVGYTEGNKQGGMWGGAGGAIDGYFGGPIFKAHMKRLKDWYTYPQLDKLELNSPTAGLDKWLEQVPYAERLNKVLDLLNSKDNAQFQRTISSADSNLIRNAGQFGANTASYLRGEIPKDVLEQVGRTAAWKSLSGGYGGSQMASALKARDFGLTSLDLQKRGGDALNQEYALDLALNPHHNAAQDMFTTPQDLLQRDDRQTTYNNSIANQQKALDFASNIAVKGGGQEALNGVIAGMYGGGGNKPVYNQPQQGGGLDMATIMKLFGGGGGASAGASSAGSSYAGFGGG